MPTYSPTVVYGGWSYPSYYYPPMYFPPPSGYGADGVRRGLVVGRGDLGRLQLGLGGSDVNININRHNNFNRNTNINGGEPGQPEQQGRRQAAWQHNAEHRGGVNYSDTRPRSNSARTRLEPGHEGPGARLRPRRRWRLSSWASVVPARPPARSAAATPGLRRAMPGRRPAAATPRPATQGQRPGTAAPRPAAAAAAAPTAARGFQHGSLREQPRGREPWRRRHEPRRRRRRAAA